MIELLFFFSKLNWPYIYGLISGLINMSVFKC